MVLLNLTKLNLRYAHSPIYRPQFSCLSAQSRCIYHIYGQVWTICLHHRHCVLQASQCGCNLCLTRSTWKKKWPIHVPTTHWKNWPVSPICTRFPLKLAYLWHKMAYLWLKWPSWDTNWPIWDTNWPICDTKAYLRYKLAYLWHKLAYFWYKRPIWETNWSIINCALIKNLSTPVICSMKCKDESF